MKGGDEILRLARSAGVGRGWLDIGTERIRQVMVEGFTADHDRDHDPHILISAAVSYAIAGKSKAAARGALDDKVDCGRVWTEVFAFWPWRKNWWKPKGQRENLVRAGALIAAAIDRLDSDEAERRQRGARHVG